MTFPGWFAEPGPFGPFTMGIYQVGSEIAPGVYSVTAGSGSFWITDVFDAPDHLRATYTGTKALLLDTDLYVHFRLRADMSTTLPPAPGVWCWIGPPDIDMFLTLEMPPESLQVMMPTRYRSGYGWLPTGWYAPLPVPDATLVQLEGLDSSFNTPQMRLRAPGVPQDRWWYHGGGPGYPLHVRYPGNIWVHKGIVGPQRTAFGDWNWFPNTSNSELWGPAWSYDPFADEPDPGVMQPFMWARSSVYVNKFLDITRADQWCFTTVDLTPTRNWMALQGLTDGFIAIQVQLFHGHREYTFQEHGYDDNSGIGYPGELRRIYLDFANAPAAQVISSFGDERWSTLAVGTDAGNIVTTYTFEPGTFGTSATQYSGLSDAYQYYWIPTDQSADYVQLYLRLDMEAENPPPPPPLDTFAVLNWYVTEVHAHVFTWIFVP